METLPIYESEIDRELANNEQLLWTGRPRQGVVFHSHDIFLIPFSLLWGGFAFFWEILVITQKAPFFFAIFGIPFVLVGLYMIIGRFIVDVIKREHTYYGLTNQRIIIISGVNSRKVKSIYLHTLTDISLTEKHNKTGTISFGQPNRYPWWFGYTYRNDLPECDKSFDTIPQVKMVYHKILNAQTQAMASQVYFED